MSCEKWYPTLRSGRDVVIENLRTLCVFQQANNTAQPWKWWDYVTAFGDKWGCTS
jgi:hypothetical protein